MQTRLICLVGALFLRLVCGSLFEAGFEFDIGIPFLHDDLGYESLNGEESWMELEKRNAFKGLQDFTPITNTIQQSGMQYYSFNVNTSSGLGQYYEFLIFISGNICSQPKNLSLDDPSLAMYYSFNSGMFQNLELGNLKHFQNGYVEVLADVPIGNENNLNETILYIAIQAPQSTNITASWTYELGVSQNGLVFQWDDRTWAQLVDTDDNSALIVTGNLTTEKDQNYSTLNATDSRYSLFIYPLDYKNYFHLINNSWCAVRSGPALFSTLNFNVSYTTRSGDLQQQFFVSGLNSSTKYVAYLIADFQSSSFGGVVYQPFEFETMDSDICRLVYDLDFCDKVAYSVPNSRKFTSDELKEKYDHEAKSFYSNFSKALQQINCDTVDNAIFSPVRTCDDCKVAYKDWLCAVTIPRCSTKNTTGYLRREVNDSRNVFTNEVIEPFRDYYEVLPCLNVCQVMVKDCPAEFGFACPDHNRSLQLSYYWEPSCNYVGPVRYTSNSSRFYVKSWWLTVFIAFINLSYTLV